MFFIQDADFDSIFHEICPDCWADTMEDIWGLLDIEP